MTLLKTSLACAGVIGGLCVWPALPGATELDIGVFTAVEGKVSVQHAQSLEATPAKLRDTVFFRDLIETQKESRTKALLNDDSILTVGEHSRVEITEHLFDPKRNLRSVVVNLVQGRVRALVGRVFAGSGSKFEVHTPTAVAAARGTYFVVWHMDGASGIANIGSHGDVDFHSGGHTVSVTPGTYSLAPPGGGPPAAPALMAGSHVPSQVTAAVEGTEVPSTPERENPAHAAAASGGTAPVQSPPSSTNLSAATSGAASGTTVQTGTTSTLITGMTPPAVISGAVTESTRDSGGGDAGDSGGSTGGGETGGGGGGIMPRHKGLHLGQLGLQPAFGNPTPGNAVVPPAVISGAAPKPSFIPPGHGGTPPGLSGDRGGKPPGTPGNGPPTNPPGEGKPPETPGKGPKPR